MHDAIAAEKTGVAATAIITDRFVQTAQAMAQVSGMPAFPFAVIPHPISHNDAAALRAKAVEALQQCVAILVQPEKMLYRCERSLLLPQEENDKSKFLASAGYTLANWELLEDNLRQFAETYEVSDREISPYGVKYEVHGTLNGPNGRMLHVVTVWITLEATGETRFVTLFPRREAN